MVSSGSYPQATAGSLVELLQWRALQQPEVTAYTFLHNGHEPAYTYRELDRRARLIGAALRERCGSGERVLLVLPPGLDYVAAFFGCLYAGVIAVPVYPPEGSGTGRSMARLEAIIADAEPVAAITLSGAEEYIATLAQNRPAFGKLRWVHADAQPDAGAPTWAPEPVGPDTLAFLQYTSGSTATPKGVMVSHGNLLHNGADIQSFFRLGPSSKSVIWLPPYHDMGLIGGILQPLYSGYPTVLMSPTDMVRRPLKWLQAISDHRATVSGGPNFAYELCTRKIEAEDLDGLDLSCWQLAFNGAEPIRPDVLDGFAELLEPAGFRRAAFYPCYGLAEGTLIVSGGDPAQPPLLKQTGAAPPLVGCGRASARQRLAIVDPQLRTTCADGAVGEIWVAGPSVAQGYWKRPEETVKIFDAHLADTGEGPFLRTGDLGFLDDGELFISGRIKDVIIQRGVNHYPSDIEYTAFRTHPALQPNGGAAFSVTVDGQERLVVAHELARRRLDADTDEVIAAIRQAVGAEHLLTVHAVLLLRPGRLPRTSSGKIQRHAVRDGYARGTLDLLAEKVFGPPQTARRPPRPAGPDSAGEVADAVRPGSGGEVVDAVLPESVVRLLRHEVADRTGTDPDGVDLSLTGPALGLDSVAILEIQHKIETSFAVELPADGFHDSSLAEISRQVVAGTLATRPAPVSESSHRASYGQRGLWFLDQMAGCGPAYNLAGAVRLPADVDIATLERALQALVDRHAVLRTTFVSEGGELIRRIEPEQAIVLEIREGAAPEERELAEAAHETFDLEQGPLLRAHLWTGSEPVLLLVIHHIVSDFWSLALLLDELAVHYVSAETPSLPEPADYAGYVAWQAAYLAGRPGQAGLAYWKRQLGGELPQLGLLTDRPRPPVQSFRGAGHPFRLDEELTRRLRELARASGTTLYTALLCAFEVLLHRYTGQTDILVGSPTSGRGRSAFAGTVGYLVNPVVIRGDLRGDPSFRMLLGRFAQTVSDALAHQHVPFGLLAEVLQPVRDPGRSPVFQAMFIYHQAPMAFSPELGLLAAGQAGNAFEIAGLRFEPVPVPAKTAQFDLTLTMAAGDDELAGSFQYNADLFDAETIAELAANFATLLSGLADDPGRPIGSVPLMDEDRRARTLSAWNDTARPFPEDLCVHEAFEVKAAEQPDAVAIICGSDEITYRELDERANRIAGRLARLGAGPDVLVGLCMDRSSHLVAGLLGILKAGAAYVPLDPDYPRERLGAIVADGEIGLLVTRSGLLDRLPESGAVVVDLDADISGPARIPTRAESRHLAYVLYTSGSTGTPKGVAVTHRNVTNFFAGMDDEIGCDDGDTLLALTSIAFDISVLELLWTLTRGARVVVMEGQVFGRPKNSDRPLDFSLFYFSSSDSVAADDRYRLIFEGARFADRHGFAAVWTPERHFHEFGGLYPNPSVLSAALAAITKNVAVRAGSVVLPLHSPIRVAEEWALVDNISGGRAGIAFASGWHADDFVFFPEHYADRKERMFNDIQVVQKLWRGESITAAGGSGSPLDIRIYPAPIQPALPTWITAAGSPETFVKAGEIGANVLTHLLGQTVEQIAANIRRYRDARAAHGHAPDSGKVTLMLHTFIGEDREEVRAQVKEPFTAYLRTSVGLIENLVKSMNLPLDLSTISESDMDALLDFTFDRYFETSALFGTPESVQPFIERLKAAGVDEVACLVDFGLPEDVVLAHLPHLDSVRRRSAATPVPADRSLAARIETHRPTLLQSTPSVMQMIATEPDSMAGLRSLRALLLGGEALPPALVRSLREALPATVMNMYGPTEATVWSATHEVGEDTNTIPLGTPIANTEMYIVDAGLEPVPVGVLGELLIGGAGVSRGYWRRPGQTAESFIPDPFGGTPGARLYRTGDLARYRADGTIDFLGRADRQVKVRGLRIEPGDIESALGRRPQVREAVVVARGTASGDLRLIAYVVPCAGASLTVPELQRALREELPQSMVPSEFVVLPRLPLTATGKVDVNALPQPERTLAKQGAQAPPSTDLERRIAAIWKEVLRVESVGVYDNFFDSGGHSLLMVQVHAQLQTFVDDHLPLIKLFEHPTVSSLASYLGSARSSTHSFAASQERARKQRASRYREASGRSRT
jgi:natural product biosynthesis luciferase-like monooxygenase protein